MANEAGHDDHLGQWETPDGFTVTIEAEDLTMANDYGVGVCCLGLRLTVCGYGGQRMEWVHSHHGWFRRYRDKNADELEKEVHKRVADAKHDILKMAELRRRLTTVGRRLQ